MRDPSFEPEQLAPPAPQTEALPTLEDLLGAVGASSAEDAHFGARVSDFSEHDFRAFRIEPADRERIEAYLINNPEYALFVEGRAPQPGCADGWVSPHHARPTRKAFVVDDVSGEVVALIDLEHDREARGIWHLGLFHVATARHGTSLARRLYSAMEMWLVSQRARWLRLGVVDCNTRALRFWRRVGFVELKRQEGMVLGEHAHTYIVMAKPLWSAEAAAALRAHTQTP